MNSIIHIGTNKTGTSSLQDFFFHNADKLIEKGILYPDIGMDMSAHHNLSRAIKRDPHALKSSDEFRQLEEKAESLDQILFSSESFHTIIDTEKIAHVFEPGKTDIIVYIREHSSYLSSWYQQALQARNTSIDFEEFIELFSANYTDLIQRWTTVYGKDRVHVKLYDRKLLHEGDVITDFMFNYLNLDVGEFKRLDHERNPSISGNLLFIKKILNNFISREESLEIVYELSALSKLDEAFQGKISVPEQLLKKIAHMYRFDRQWLRDNYGIKIIPVKEKKSNDVFPDYDTLPGDYKRMVDFSMKNNFRIMSLFDRFRFLALN